MRLFDRLSNGWKLGKTSLRTILDNPSLMLFPVISGFSLVLVSISFFGGGYLLFGEEILAVSEDGNGENQLSGVAYFLAFIFYFINYFLIVFFNVGLVHCARMILEGRPTSVGEGLRFAQTRLMSVLGWALLAATVGIILKTIQEKTGSIGSIITGIIGIIWSVATFFVVPVLAYEDLSPFEAIKRSASIMKEKWGESIGANFSFGLFTLIGLFLSAFPIGILLAIVVHPIVGIIAGILVFLVVQAAISAAKMVFVSAAYQHVNNEPTGYFKAEELDDVFVPK